VLRDFPVRFQQGRFTDRKADKDLVLPNAYNSLTQAKCIRCPYTRPIRSGPAGGEVVRVVLETRREIAMRTSIRRQLAKRLAVAIGFAALQATLATTSLPKTCVVHHRSAPAASSADSANRGNWRVPPTGYAADQATVLASRYDYPNPFPGECTEDEGYGRFKRCDSGP
jgi:hypothetical protein